ncbi:MAG: hypothetical protein ACSLFN_15270 [Candidatus Limnocylindrales bacterium]
MADAGLLLPATLAQHLGLRELVDRFLHLGDKPGRANAGDKLLTLVMSALAGGDCIDDANALRAGGTGRILGFRVKAASTLGTFLRSFRWGHVRQLDRVSRELLARAWAAGAGPGDDPLTIVPATAVFALIGRPPMFGLASWRRQRDGCPPSRSPSRSRSRSAPSADPRQSRRRRARRATPDSAAAPSQPSGPGRQPGAFLRSVASLATVGLIAARGPTWAHTGQPGRISDQRPG